MSNQNAGTSKGKRGRPAVLVRTPTVEDSQFATNPTSLRTRQNALESSGKKVIDSVDRDKHRGPTMGEAAIVVGTMAAAYGGIYAFDKWLHNQCMKSGEPDPYRNC
ncbi:hypothetical protein BC835DRAFT_1420043 [Cytidiella melzeri]|nr:hypothetical protein BC835DRAFT_1420043 [Cytidiella melzeri]